MRCRFSLISSALGTVLFCCLLASGLVSCTPVPSAVEAQVDSLNFRAYRMRYANIDSSLRCAQRAMELAADYSAGRAFAYNNLAYVAYQQMRYGESIAYLDTLYRASRNQVELLCADVMYMKVAQRTGQGLLFFKHRSMALGRIKRLKEDDSSLSSQQRARLRYAHSELHIISCTYYFYYGQEEQAIREINRTPLDETLPADTAQWIYYRYMLGSGGLIEGEAHEVALKEFDHLFTTYNTARVAGLVYFEANALQSMATLLDNPETNALIAENRPNALVYLNNQHKDWHSLPEIEDYAKLSLVMADRARHLFSNQKDLFQLACAYRTVGEIYFRHGMYNLALRQFTHALDLVESQKQRSQLQVPFWTFSMREYLSLTYSALGDKQNSDYHRNLYLDYLEQYTQDYEMEERKNQLEQEVQRTRLSLFVLLGLILLTVLLLWLIIRRMQHQSRQVTDSIGRFDTSPEWKRFEQEAGNVRTALGESIQEVEEETGLHRIRIRDYRHGNVERRAKVSLVYAIVPYLDRIIAEVERMRRAGEADEERLRYVSELAGEIMQVNRVLTDWIQMKQGQLKLHITTFPLQDVFDIIRGSHSVFERQGLALQVENTPCRVKADMALTLFMTNTLCDNARKFTPSGGTVCVSAEAKDDYVEVSVTDTGEGLSAHDVEVLGQQKIYDPAQLGESKTGKGFGFGIMNCKGIIAKYRKTSAKFRVGDFGVESRVGQGSRFWFRLPIAPVLVLMLCFCQTIMAQNTPHCAKCDSITRANIEGRYREAYAYGEQVLDGMKAHPVDTPTAIHILNEMAVSALSLKDWDNYHRCNKECVRLHNLYTADESLPAYCQQMERMKSNNVFVYALLVLLSLLALVLFWRLSLRGIMRRDTYAHTLHEWLRQRIRTASSLMACYAAYPQRSEWQPLLEERPEWIGNVPPALEASCTECSERMRAFFQETDALTDRMDALVNENRRLRFEEDRLYVMNQVLDNCLSTIKHETMYYPARTQQLVDYIGQSDSAHEQASHLAELTELVHFYRRVYLLLYQQAERQVEQNNFYRERMLLSELDPALPALPVVADRMLLQLLLATLKQAEGVAPQLTARMESPFVYVRVTYPRILRTEAELEALFLPTTAHIPFLIPKQIIREHDAYSGHTGLRLIAEAAPEGYAILFTLLYAKP